MPIILLILQVETIEDYDEYCHYVAGLVGLGLSKLFHASKLEDLASDELSNSMGLFLQVIVVLIWYDANSCFILHPPSQCLVSPEFQKTNIIRDYLEDINEIPKSRMFWPREIWSKYVNKLEVCPFHIFHFQIVVVSTSLPVIMVFHDIIQCTIIFIVIIEFQNIKNFYIYAEAYAIFIDIFRKYLSQDLKEEENSIKAVQCLNDMITNALVHIEDCLRYMSALQDPAIFRFCAIPQV